MDLEARYRAATLEQIEIERRLEAVQNAPVAVYYVPLDYVLVCAVVACILPVLEVWWHTRCSSALRGSARQSLESAIAPLPPTATSRNSAFAARLLQRCLTADPALTHFLQHELRHVMHDADKLRAVLGDPALHHLRREDWVRGLDANYFMILQCVLTSAAFDGACSPLRTRKWLARGLSVFAMDLRALFEGQLPLLHFYQWRSTRASKYRGTLLFVALLVLEHFESSEASVERRTQLYTCIECFVEGSVEAELATWSHEDRACLKREWRTCHDNPIQFQGACKAMGLPSALRCLIDVVHLARSMPQPLRRHQRLIVHLHALARSPKLLGAARLVSRLFEFGATLHMDLVINAEEDAMMTQHAVGNKKFL
ncbi:hypothetical protein SPRG_15747 [Saprolegnia parasitica CBS 223.65]|uniref:Uncharacterized protein n=1 Tax=Saprolegnia parasitica (strain CBS 223.65) TaxID=695850 RepID=A0A067BLB1_SAPPC|nr:hypothetical protein SPRG_15747 [Saprolegnia parasitica CBS 223.65]KDO18998.1 hypothetical protein SPRG_15747 [Saprolegnia parasitica CBS 223.65]|eukprot:XP_012210285.1 hypothetical protein SPRG_15747 [Saprolegnia parasitica CBS 223.65]